MLTMIEVFNDIPTLITKVSCSALFLLVSACILLAINEFLPDCVWVMLGTSSVLTLCRQTCPAWALTTSLFRCGNWMWYHYGAVKWLLKSNFPVNPHGGRRRLVGLICRCRLVCHNFLKERDVTLPCSFRITRLTRSFYFCL